MDRVVAMFFFFFSSRRRHTRYWRDWSSDVCSSDLEPDGHLLTREPHEICEGGLDLMLIQAGTQLCGGAGVGDRLQLLGLDQGTVQIEDERANHARLTPLVLRVIWVPYRLPTMLKPASRSIC